MADLRICDSEHCRHGNTGWLRVFLRATVQDCLYGFSNGFHCFQQHRRRNAVRCQVEVRWGLDSKVGADRIRGSFGFQFPLLLADLSTLTGGNLLTVSRPMQERMRDLMG